MIATDGATNQMIDGNGYGMNTPGLYDPELIGHYAQGRREHAAQMSESLKLTMLCGRYAIGRGDGRHYAMARNLALELAAAYDAALDGADVLVLPTLPIVASPLPARRQPGGATRPVTGDDRQHGTVRRHRAPATTVLAGCAMACGSA